MCRGTLLDLALTTLQLFISHMNLNKITFLLLVRDLTEDQVIQMVLERKSGNCGFT